MNSTTFSLFGINMSVSSFLEPYILFISFVFSSLRSLSLRSLSSSISSRISSSDTTYGKIGIKVWICHVEVLPTKNGINPREERKDNRRDRRDNDMSRFTESKIAVEAVKVVEEYGELTM